MYTLKSFVMDESGSASPRAGLVWNWSICALVAAMTLFGAYFQPAYAHEPCTVNCCGEENKKVWCSNGADCVQAWCLSDEPCSIALACTVPEDPEAEGP